MTLKSIYRDLMAKPRNLTAEELRVVLAEADWKHAFDLYLLCPNPPVALRDLVAQLQPVSNCQ